MQDIGSQWVRGDLHFHTPSSQDYLNKSVSNQMIIDTLIENEVKIVAITDHFCIDIERINELQKIGNDRITVFPGIEVRTELGGKDQIHLTAVFSDKSKLVDIEKKIIGTLKMTPSDIESRGGFEKFYVNYEKAINIFSEIDGLIFVHAGGKSNSIEAISNSELYKQTQKKRYDQEATRVGCGFKKR